jgi:Gpi18-like mannosyltransferase
MGTTTAGPYVRTSEVGFRTHTLRRALVYCTTVLLIGRLGLTLVSFFARQLPGSTPAGVPGWPAPKVQGAAEFVGTALERWDALWFLRIAADGYRLNDGSAAFWPGYPLATRALGTVFGGHTLGAALSLSAVFSIAALVLFYLLGTREFGEPVARRSVLYLAFFPTAFFLAAPYSESIFLCFSVAALLAARSKHWWVAALCAALASGTRPLGMVLAVPLALEALAEQRGRRRSMVAATASVMGPVAASLSGAAAYLVYWGLRSGNALQPFSSQAQWLRTASWPWETVSQATNFAWRFHALWHRIDWLLTIPFIALALWSLTWMRASYATYVWGSLAIILSFVFPARPLMSVPRFLLVLFPLFWALARLTDRTSLHLAVALGLGAGQALIAAFFMAWYPMF